MVIGLAASVTSEAAISLVAAVSGVAVNWVVASKWLPLQQRLPSLPILPWVLYSSPPPGFRVATVDAVPVISV